MVIEYDAAHVGKRLYRELTKNRIRYYTSLALFVLCLLVFLLYEQMPKCGQVALGLACCYWLYSIVRFGKMGTLRLRTIAESMPTEPAEECVPVLLRLVPFVLTRRIAADKIYKALQPLMRSEAKQINTTRWKLLYKYYYRGNLEQKQLVIRAAHLLADKEALPYLRKISSAMTTTPEMRSRTDLVIAELEGRL